jgi:hypothetical protein
MDVTPLSQQALEPDKSITRSFLMCNAPGWGARHARKVESIQ